MNTLGRSLGMLAVSVCLAGTARAHDRVAARVGSVEPAQAVTHHVTTMLKKLDAAEHRTVARGTASLRSKVVSRLEGGTVFNAKIRGNVRRYTDGNGLAVTIAERSNQDLELRLAERSNEAGVGAPAISRRQRVRAAGDPRGVSERGVVEMMRWKDGQQSRVATRVDEEGVGSSGTMLLTTTRATTGHATTVMKDLIMRGSPRTLDEGVQRPVHETEVGRLTVK